MREKNERIYLGAVLLPIVISFIFSSCTGNKEMADEDNVKNLIQKLENFKRGADTNEVKKKLIRELLGYEELACKLLKGKYVYIVLKHDDSFIIEVNKIKNNRLWGKEIGKSIGPCVHVNDIIDFGFVDPKTVKRIREIEGTK